MTHPSPAHPVQGLVTLTLAIALGACSVPSSSATSRASTAGPASPTAGPASPAASPTRTPAPSRAPSLVSGPDHVGLVAFASRLDSPIGITSSGDGSGRLFVNEQAGVIAVVGANGVVRSEPFLDLRDRVLSGGERGLLGLAFHPGYPAEPRIYVDYTRRPDGATIISELHATTERADPASERVLLVIPQPYANHNGGQLAFGPDGDLYIGMGDGGSGGDPHGNGQTTHALLGKIRRIDVDGPRADGRAYAIPDDNPFAAGGADPGGGAPEVWAYGLRNPWRFSFDSASGDLYIADVGQSAWEEIDRQPAGAAGGANYGWNAMEGRHCYTVGCDPKRYVAPIAEYGHDQGCAVVGGYVYRGAGQPQLKGAYLFGDDCSGTIFTLELRGGAVSVKPILSSGKQVSAFGVGDDGELYLADLGGGGIYRVVAG